MHIAGTTLRSIFLINFFSSIPVGGCGASDSELSRRVTSVPSAPRVVPQSRTCYPSLCFFLQSCVRVCEAISKNRNEMSTRKG